MSKPDHRQDDIDRASADWTARLSGDPLSDAERQGLQRWLGESPAHAAAFETARATLARLDGLRFAPGALARDNVPPHPVKVVALPAGGRTRRRIWIQAGTLAASLLLAVASISFWLGDPMTLLLADYRTAPGESQAVILPDGSIVDLGPASAITLHYTAGERRVELLSGLAYFTVAPMKEPEARPFVVEAAGGTARALGTQFIVDRLPDAVDVTVAEHDVEVAFAAAGEPPQRVTLSPGQSVRYDDAAGLGPVRDSNPDQVASWRRGRLIFDQVPLSEVVAALNRYRRGTIVISDSALAARRVSGVFEIGDPDAVLATITRELNIQAASVPPLMTLLY